MKMSHTNLRKALGESLTNPNDPGPLKVILEANNPTYYLQRAQEILREVQTPGASASLKKLRSEKLKLAITLLAAVRVIEAEEPLKPAKVDNQQVGGEANGKT